MNITRTLPEQDLKSVNNIAFRDNEVATLYSSSDLQYLQFIASQCPFEYGENVYLSRIILKAMGDTTEYFNDCEYENIEAPEKSSIVNSSDEIFTMVYPNPAKNELTIETDMVLPAIFTLFSLLGEELYSVQINDEYSIIYFGNLEPQLVMYKIQSSNGVISRGTLTIIK